MYDCGIVVQIDDAMPNKQGIEYGVSQSFILDPLLFRYNLSRKKVSQPDPWRTTNDPLLSPNTLHWVPKTHRWQRQRAFFMHKVANKLFYLSQQFQVNQERNQEENSGALRRERSRNGDVFHPNVLIYEIDSESRNRNLRIWRPEKAELSDSMSAFWIGNIFSSQLHLSSFKPVTANNSHRHLSYFANYSVATVSRFPPACTRILI